jgi:hypothetical protein
MYCTCDLENEEKIEKNQQSKYKMDTIGNLETMKSKLATLQKEYDELLPNVISYDEEREYLVDTENRIREMELQNKQVEKDHITSLKNFCVYLKSKLDNVEAKSKPSELERVYQEMSRLKQEIKESTEKDYQEKER